MITTMMVVMVMGMGVVQDREVEMTVTAYCPCEKCCGKYGWGYRTASGYKIKKGDRFVAAPKGVAFGTGMRVPGYNGGKVVRVEDRGGAIKGSRLDVYFDTHKAALAWGVQKIKVTIVGTKGTGI